MRVFAGPRDDAFYFDSGATFDFLNFRAPAPVLTGRADTGAGAAYPNAVDGFAGYNISLIAVEMPISMVTADGAMPTDPRPIPTRKIAGWASTISPDRDRAHRARTIRKDYGDYVQVDRVGNPLTVEALIPLPHEGLLESQPARERSAVRAVHRQSRSSPPRNPERRVRPERAASAPRNDLLGVYVPDITRIDLTIPPTPAGQPEPPGTAGW